MKNYRAATNFMLRIAAFISACLLVACSEQEVSTNTSSPAEVETEKSVPIIGTLNEDGRLVMWTIDAFDHVEPFILRDDYGVILYNEGSEDKPDPRYLLASQEARSVLITANFDQFRRELELIPEGTVIGRYDTCSVPRCYGLPEPVIIEFDDALAKAGLRVETGERSVCYCPNHGY
jgi:hypothetical protein